MRRNDAVGKNIPKRYKKAFNIVGKVVNLQASNFLVNLKYFTGIKNEISPILNSSNRHAVSL
jgi:hypothetical protein